jgi:hypothetical protein
MSKKGTVILKRKGGLGNIKSLKGNPREYFTNDKNPETEGVYAGEYKEPTLPSARQWLSPLWSDLEDQWCWGGTQEQLASIVDAMKLKYPKGHPQEGQIIKDANLKDFQDAFFKHKHWYLKKAMQGGRIMLNRDIPEDEFFHLIFKGAYNVDDKTEASNILTEVTGAKFELINPKVAKAKQAKDAKKEISAVKFLAESSFERMTLIAEIMDAKTYNFSDPDPDSLFMAIKDEFATNTELCPKFNNKSWQEWFIELADKKQTPNSDLEIMASIMRAKRFGILRNRGSYWQFNSGNNRLPDRIEGQLNDLQLINFFRQVDNQEYFIELEKQLKEKQKQ